MRPIDKIVIHHSASNFGSVDEIRRWHLERGFTDIGYHYVIYNGRLAHDDEYSHHIDGIISTGRDIEDIGAHVKGHNKYSIGICLIGCEKKDYTDAQLQSLYALLHMLLSRFPAAVIYGHKEIDERKPTCPDLDMKIIRKKFDIYKNI